MKNLVSSSIKCFKSKNNCFSKLNFSTTFSFSSFLFNLPKNYFSYYNPKQEASKKLLYIKYNTEIDSLTYPEEYYEFIQFNKTKLKDNEIQQIINYLKEKPVNEINLGEIVEVIKILQIEANKKLLNRNSNHKQLNNILEFIFKKTLEGISILQDDKAPFIKPVFIEKLNSSILTTQKLAIESISLSNLSTCILIGEVLTLTFNEPLIQNVSKDYQSKEGFYLAWSNYFVHISLLIRLEKEKPTANKLEMLYSIEHAINSFLKAALQSTELSWIVNIERSRNSISNAFNLRSKRAGKYKTNKTKLMQNLKSNLHKLDDLYYSNEKEEVEIGKKEDNTFKSEFNSLFANQLNENKEINKEIFNKVFQRLLKQAGRKKANENDESSHNSNLQYLDKEFTIRLNNWFSDATEKEVNKIKQSFEILESKEEIYLQKERNIENLKQIILEFKRKLNEFLYVINTNIKDNSEEYKKNDVVLGEAYNESLYLINELISKNKEVFNFTENNTNTTYSLDNELLSLLFNENKSN